MRHALGQDLVRDLLRATWIASPSGRPSRFPEIVTLRCRSTRVIAEGAAVFSTVTRLRSSTTPPVARARVERARSRPARSGPSRRGARGCRSGGPASLKVATSMPPIIAWMVEASVRASTPRAAAFSRSGSHAELGPAELQALVEVDEAALRLELVDHLVREPVERVEVDVAAQVDRELAAVARHHHAGHVAHLDPLAGDRRERGARVEHELLRAPLALRARLQHGEHHAVGRLRRAGALPAGARRREQARDLGLRQDPLLVLLEDLERALHARARRRLELDEEAALVRGREELGAELRRRSRAPRRTTRPRRRASSSGARGSSRGAVA